MITVKIKDRGRDLVYHRVESKSDAEEIAQVYKALGYASEKIVLEFAQPEQALAA